MSKPEPPPSKMRSMTKKEIEAYLASAVKHKVSFRDQKKLDAWFDELKKQESKREKEQKETRFHVLGVMNGAAHRPRRRRK